MSRLTLSVEGVSKKFCRSLKRSLWYGVKDLASEMFLQRAARAELRKDEFWAVRDVSIELHRGETLGLVGHNGAGKSTLLKLINGSIRPDKGRIRVRGKVGALIELGMGFNPILTGRENIYVNAAILGLKRAEVNRRFDDIVSFAGIDGFLDTPVQNYSSGMKARLGFAVAAHVDPDLLLIDEVLSVGDAAFRQRCIDRLSDYKNKGGTIIFVSHNPTAITAVCDRVLWLEHGRAVADGDPNRLVQEYELRAMEASAKAQERNAERHGADDVDDIRLTAVECRDQGGNARAEFEFREPFEVWIRYEAREGLSSPYFTIEIKKTVPEMTSAWISMLWDGIDLGRIPRQGTVRCMIENPDLTPGHYQLKVGVQSLASSVLGKKNYAPRRPYGGFTVRPGTLRDRFPGIGADELVSLPPVLLNYKWDLNGTTAARGRRALPNGDRLVDPV